MHLRRACACLGKLTVTLQTKLKRKLTAAFELLKVGPLSYPNLSSMYRCVFITAFISTKHCSHVFQKTAAFFLFTRGR